MARNWKDVRADAVTAGLIDETRVAEAGVAMREEIRAHKLAEIRKAHNLSQAVVAEAMGVAQPRVSAIERGALSSTEVGTLQGYIEALGGKLRVVADFGDETLTVTG